ncbi:vanadium-dependent haloperoxidase [Synechococcus sp. RedBA-s]|nr:vanadium-dependent haloperoxidase [Synechococcus sp. RedBA-s]
MALPASDVDLAAAAACHQVLRLRYPNQSSMIEPAWLNWLDYFQVGNAAGSFETVGRAFGTAVHQIGISDPANAAAGQYIPPNPPVPYAHALPVFEPGQGFAGGIWGQSNRLATVAVPAGDFPPPPGRVDSNTVNPTSHYQQDFAKVALKGDINRSLGVSGVRTLEEEVIGIAWGYDGPQELGTPPRLYLQVVLRILDALDAQSPGQLSNDDEVKIIAAVAVAMADAGIEAWFYKYALSHMMWRPVVGIRNAVPGNGVADPNWLPLGRPNTNSTGAGFTPNFPAYPSGHATFGCAAFQLLRLFLVEKGLASFNAEGVDNVRFEFISDEFDGRNRDPRTMRPRELVTLSYESLWKAIVDNSVSRVYLGVHWEFDGITTRDSANTGDEFGIPPNPKRLGKTGGVWLGAQIANQIAKDKLMIASATVTASGMS